MGNYGGCDTCGSRRNCDCAFRAQLAEALEQVRTLTEERDYLKQQHALAFKGLVENGEEADTAEATLSRLREALRKLPHSEQCKFRCPLFTPVDCDCYLSDPAIVELLKEGK